jgi:hypothetical protein
MKKTAWTFGLISGAIMSLLRGVSRPEGHCERARRIRRGVVHRRSRVFGHALRAACRSTGECRDRDQTYNCAN